MNVLAQPIASCCAAWHKTLIFCLSAVMAMAERSTELVLTLEDYTVEYAQYCTVL